MAQSKTVSIMCWQAKCFNVLRILPRLGCALRAVNIRCEHPADCPVLSVLVPFKSRVVVCSRDLSFQPTTLRKPKEFHS